MKSNKAPCFCSATEAVCVFTVCCLRDTLIFLAILYSSMECSIPQAFSSKAASSAVKNLQPGQSPPKSMLHVNFELDNEEMHERKKKYLTAKYGQHQMSLIRKRLSVEMWMYDQLQVLYDTPEESHYEVEIDLDELLDIESEPARREWLKKKLVGVKQSEDAVEKFITELLQRATTL